jgi:hypothetical protein
MHGWLHDMPEPCRNADEQMMQEWRAQWHIGTGGATDPDFPMGFVQIGPMGNDEGDNADSFLIRMGQTANCAHHSAGGPPLSCRKRLSFLAESRFLTRCRGTNVTLDRF